MVQELAGEYEIRGFVALYTGMTSKGLHRLTNPCPGTAMGEAATIDPRLSRDSPKASAAAAVGKRTIFMLITSGIVGRLNWKFRLARPRYQSREGEERREPVYSVCRSEMAM